MNGRHALMSRALGLLRFCASASARTAWECTGLECDSNASPSHQLVNIGGSVHVLSNSALCKTDAERAVHHDHGFVVPVLCEDSFGSRPAIAEQTRPHARSLASLSAPSSPL
jgi:hypothetical protein